MEPTKAIRYNTTTHKISAGGIGVLKSDFLVAISDISRIPSLRSAHERYASLAGALHRSTEHADWSCNGTIRTVFDLLGKIVAMERGLFGER